MAILALPLDLQDISSSSTNEEEGTAAAVAPVRCSSVQNSMVSQEEYLYTTDDVLHQKRNLGIEVQQRQRLAFRGICAVSISGYIQYVRAQESNLSLSDGANFLDAGLTALGLITALVTTILRRRLDAETNTRDLLTLLRGQRQGSVKILDVYAQHSLSQVLVLVEENSATWAQQLFSYYGATTGKNAELMPVAWLCPPNLPATNCTCSVTCKCLRLERVEGVCEHLIAVAPGSVFRLDDRYDAIICVSCAFQKCHASQNCFYQKAEGGMLGPLGPQIPFNVSCRTLLKSIADVFAEEGHTGLMLLEPANDESVTWGSTILEASSVKDAEERGNENPFTASYRKALAGEPSATLTETKFDTSLWWLSRISAQCEISIENHFNVVILAPWKGRYSLPVHRLLMATVLEVLLVLLWITIMAITPWFHLVGSSYLNGLSIWATVLSCVVVLLACSINIIYWRTARLGKFSKWAVLISICTFFDTSVLIVAALFWAKVETGHWIATVMRSLLMLGAISQWVLGVEYMPSMTIAEQNQQGMTLIVPYALTFVRLLALVAGGGKWA
ncbi:unnamed protein product [Sphagnum troendelagicum]